MVSLKKLTFSGMAALCNKVLKNTSTQTLLFNSIRLNRSEVSQALENEEARFLGYCFSRRDYARSQILQDLWVCFELGEKRDGFFVEFGATNGLKNSNTWLLETKFGWKGILAEPNPIWHDELFANRRASIERMCVSSTSGDVVTFVATDTSDPELSAIASFSDGDHFAAVRSKGRRIQVETISLDDLLDKYGAPPVIDYMSIDTEGSELAILSAFSFNRKIKLLSVENNPKTEREIDALLRRKGYVRVFRQFSQWDGWYVSEELRVNQKREIIAPAA
ncbi:FkbM family methyltransferase [Rhizobium sp. S96]|nr:FkbM family methyltransferase [Rhizobium sp. S96]